MKGVSILLLCAFFLLSIAQVSCIVADWQLGIHLTKPLLMATLAAWFCLETRLSTTLYRFVFYGLLFSIAGDTFLMFVGENPNFFLFGLSSFLVTHVFYILAFWKFPGIKTGLVWRKPWLLLPVLAYLTAMLGYLWPDLPEAFKIPVLVYSCVISAMLVFALNMVGRIPDAIARLLVVGALLFVLSDSLIAVGKFKTTGVPETVFSLAIMLTYLIGQYLIASRSRQIYLAGSPREAEPAK